MNLQSSCEWREDEELVEKQEAPRGMKPLAYWQGLTDVAAVHDAVCYSLCCGVLLQAATPTVEGSISDVGTPDPTRVATPK